MMVTFDHTNVRFSCRAIALLFRGDEILLHRAEGNDLWTLPGGRVELLEAAYQTIKREMWEELHIEVNVERLVWIVDSFFVNTTFRYHEIGFYFLVCAEPNNTLYHHHTEFYGQEDINRLIFQWRPVHKLQELELYPSFLRHALYAIPKQTTYLVYREDLQDNVT